MKINHVGYLVGNIEKSIHSFEMLGYKKKTEVIRDLNRKIDICFMLQGGYTIELVSPIDETSVVYNTYKKVKEGPYHICYEVKNIEEAIRELKKKGYIAVQPIEEAIAFGGSLVVFMYHKYVGLIELVEVDT